MKQIKVQITFLEEILGTAAADPAVHEKYIASKAPDAPSLEEEVAALGADEVVERTRTVFARDENGSPVIWDYQIRGFFKSKASALKKVAGTRSSGLKAHKKEIDELIFVRPRKIPLVFAGEPGNCQRPLRADTPQGSRVALANSETVPAGATCSFTVVCINDKDVELVREWLEMGEFNGLGQWRNSGKGAFAVDTFEVA